MKVPDNTPQFITDIVDKFNKLPSWLKLLYFILIGIIILLIASAVLIISIMACRLFILTFKKKPIITIVTLIILIFSYWLIRHYSKNK